jgi:enamine deaminase RidA (YjgF/YER057c/UK114 family)
MITDRFDPPGLLKIPEIVNVSVATGTRIIHISGQTAVDAEGKVVGTTHLEQSRLAFRNVRTAKEVFGDPYPLTANTLVGVASLWLPDLLVEVDAVAII